MEKKIIGLEKEKETLLVPLYSKALESRKDKPIILDKKAVEIVNEINYDFSQLKIPKKTHVTLCMRVKQFDNYALKFLKKYPEPTIVHLGCGLDSRYIRVDNGFVQWYDLDYPEVIELKKNFFQESDRYHLISSSVTDFEWINKIARKKGSFLFLAEGLFMYLKDEEVKNLVLKLQQNFPGCLLVFDCYSTLTAKHIKSHPSMRKTGADVYWGIDNAHKIEEWNDGIILKEEWYFTQSNEINKLSLSYRFLYRVAGMFKTARKAHRILVFQL